MKKTASANSILLIFLFFILYSSCNQDQKSSPSLIDRPNVILIMTDDQGIGDFGFMGNPFVKTTNLDRLAAESLHLTNFYVSPVCAPTRASLMTGRYSERTGIYDTYNGGAIMSDDEVTIAEVLREHGYKTGIFGKWHLGDNYPYRPIDQGFDEALVHRGGGIGQPGDFPNFFARDSSYFDPVLFHNGKQEQSAGYCSDVFSDAAIDFIEKHQATASEQPFFAYISYNAPHTPLQLPKKYYDMYRDVEFDVDAFEVKDEAVETMNERDIVAAKRVYGMVTNIDDNIGRLMRTLQDNNLDEKTIVIFLTDNGPQQVRYKVGLRGRKSHVYSGGVRVPCLIRYPEKFPAGAENDLRLAHIDLLPTILGLCNIEQPEHEIDGLNFVDARDTAKDFIEGRTLFFEWGRGFPVKYQNFAAIQGEYKLVGNTGMKSEISDFELFHLDSDPYEKNNVVQDESEIALGLKEEMDAWYEEIIAEPNNNRTLAAHIGSEYENPTILNRNDTKGTPVPWGNEDVIGYWDVKVLKTGNYDVTLQFIRPIIESGNLHFKLYPQYFVQKNTQESDQITLKNIELKEGDFKLETYYRTNNGRNIFPLYVSLKKL